MRHYYALLLIMPLFLLVSCSKEVQDTSVLEATPKFTAIGEGATSVYQYDFVSFAEEGNLVDLTDELGVGTEYLTLREVGDELTFFSFTSDSFSAYQYHTITGQKRTFENFYIDSDERSITWGASSGDHLFLGFYQPKGERNLYVRVFDPVTGTEKDLFIENSVLHAYKPLFHDDKLFVSYQDADSEFHITIIEGSTLSVKDTLDFEDFAPSFLINDRNELMVIKNKQGSDQEYVIYDFDNWMVLEEGPLQINRTFVPGYLESDFIDGKLFYQNLYAQPSTLVFSPAIYDLANRSNSIIDLVGIISNFQDENSTSIIPISQGYDPIGKVILIGFGRNDNINELVGGVLVISEKGELIGHVDLPFVPTYFMKSTN